MMRHATEACLADPVWKNRTNPERNLVLALKDEIMKLIGPEIQDRKVGIEVSISFIIVWLIFAGVLGFVLSKWWREFAQACRSPKAVYAQATIALYNLTILFAVAVVVWQNGLTRTRWEVVIGKEQTDWSGMTNPFAFNPQFLISIPLQIHNPTSMGFHIPHSYASLAVHHCKGKRRDRVGRVAVSKLQLLPRDHTSVCLEIGLLEDEHLFDVIKVQKCLFKGADSHVTLIDVEFGINITFSVKLLGDHQFSAKADCRVPLALVANFCGLLIGAPRVVTQGLGAAGLVDCSSITTIPATPKEIETLTVDAFVKAAQKGFDLYDPSDGRLCKPMLLSLRGPLKQFCQVSLFILVVVWGVALTICCGRWGGKQVAEAERRWHAKSVDFSATPSVTTARWSARSVASVEHVSQTELQDFDMSPSRSHPRSSRTLELIHESEDLPSKVMSGSDSLTFSKMDRARTLPDLSSWPVTRGTVHASSQPERGRSKSQHVRRSRVPPPDSSSSWATSGELARSSTEHPQVPTSSSLFWTLPKISRWVHKTDAPESSLGASPGSSFSLPASSLKVRASSRQSTPTSSLGAWTGSSAFHASTQAELRQSQSGPRSSFGAWSNSSTFQASPQAELPQRLANPHSAVTPFQQSRPFQPTSSPAFSSSRALLGNISATFCASPSSSQALSGNVSSTFHANTQAQLEQVGSIPRFHAASCDQSFPDHWRIDTIQTVSSRASTQRIEQTSSPRQTPWSSTRA